jgi:signal peptidase I
MLVPRRLIGRLPRPWQRALDWALTIGFAVVLVLAFEAEVAKPFRVPSSSMEPTLHCARPGDGCRARFSDRVIALRIVYRLRDPHRGEIAVFNAPERAAAACRSGVYVKRVIGLPGEVISERRGAVFVDGARLSEPYLREPTGDQRNGNWGRLPEDMYFVMGDNRGSSCDSRDWGPVPRKGFIGPAAVTYWPPNRISVR